ncbi:MAG: SufD family Fe-S cluster assembly protein [Bacilli bacterium]|nr:SufD family Fe-S cluster assembly protein [Bacilli bacterium]
MSQIVQTYTFQSNEHLVINENENKIIYQDLNSSVSELSISMDKHSSLEVLFYNSNAKINCKLEEDAKLIIYNISFNKDNYEFNLNIDLNNIYADVHIINLYLGIDSSVMTSNILINHYAKQTKSLLETYAIAKDQSYLTLNNNAFIKNGMRQSDARQMTRGLNLSKNASVKAQPNLLIDEYDVVASHSASIGSIDKEELFYLMSRGLTETKAQEMVILGFIEPILGNIKSEELQQIIYAEFAKLLK